MPFSEGDVMRVIGRTDQWWEAMLITEGDKMGKIPRNQPNLVAGWPFLFLFFGCRLPINLFFP